MLSQLDLISESKPKKEATSIERSNSSCLTLFLMIVQIIIHKNWMYFRTFHPVFH